MEDLDLYHQITETTLEVKHQLVTANDLYEELFELKPLKKNSLCLFRTVHRHILSKSLMVKSHSQGFIHIHILVVLMIRLGWDVWTLSDGLSVCRFMVVSDVGFGGLAIALVFGVSTGFGAPPSLFSEKTGVVGRVGAYPGIALMWTRSLEYCVPVASSSTVYDRCPSAETSVPLDHQAFPS